MRKALAFGAATVCALGIVGGAFAAEETPIEAFYNVDESYTVTFPAEIEFDGYEDDQTVTVKAEGVFLNDGNKLKITMVSTNGALKNGSSSIAYTMTNGDSEEQAIVANTPFDILTVESGDRDGDTATLTFTSGDDTNVTLAGKHSDTLTFKVEIDDGIAFMQDIATIKTTMNVGDQIQLADRDDNNKLYWVGKLGDGNVWMTQNLDNQATASIIGPNVYYANGTTKTGTTLEGVAADSELRHYAGGSYYDWNAAKTACPQGWELPSKNQFNFLISTSIITKSNNSSSPFYGVFAGASPTSVGGHGLYWTVDEHDETYAHFLWIDNINTPQVQGEEKMVTMSVRCVAYDHSQIF